MMSLVNRGHWKLLLATDYSFCKAFRYEPKHFSRLQCISNGPHDSSPWCRGGTVGFWQLTSDKNGLRRLGGKK